MKSFHENRTTLRPDHPEKKNSTPLFNNAPLSNSAPGVGPEKNNSTPGVANREFTVIVTQILCTTRNNNFRNFLPLHYN